MRSTSGTASETAPDPTHGATGAPSVRAGLGIALPLVGAGLWAFVEVAEAAGSPTLGPLDVAAERVADDAPRGLVAALALLTHLGSVPVALALALALSAWLLRQRDGWAVAGLAVVLGAGQGLVYALKAAFARVRPEAAALLDTTGHSFPSGHAFTATALYGFALYLVWRRPAPRPLRLAASVGLPPLVALVAASRVVLGAHYLTDVVGGVLLGLLWLAGCLALLRALASPSRLPPMRAPRHVRLPLLTLLLAAGPGVAQTTPEAQVPGSREGGPVRHVIHISVDGLRPDAVTRHDPDDLPNFYRLRAGGAFTDNARTDFDYSITLPNHLSQLTGRPVLGEAGHHWITNEDPLPGETVHSRRGAYVPSVFDVAHDRGLHTGAYVSKSKFVLLDRSYDAEHGAPDVTGADDGRDKIDVFVYEPDTEALVDRFVADMRSEPLGYAFLHLRDPDTQGHRWGWRVWGWHPYMAAVRRVDRLLGEILDLVERDPRLAGRTAVVLTADHGGSGHHHRATDPAHFTVPFYVWGAGVPAGDLYALNADHRRDPGRDHLGFDAPLQSIRNGSAANLALSLLGLGPVPGSTIDAASRMRVRPAEETPGGGPVAEPGPSSGEARLPR